MNRAIAVAVVLVGVVSRASYAQEPRESVLTRLVNVPVIVNLPVGPCEVPSLTTYLTRHANVPAGVEMIPGSCGWESPRPPIVDRVHLQGMTLEEAMDRMVEIDPRYYWVENQGVIVIRPVEAWADTKHFLHTVIEKFELKDANVGAALDAVLRTFQPNRGNLSSQHFFGATEITVATGPIAVVEALEAVVREHGAMSWQVRYCLPERVPDVAMVEFRTHDDRGIGARAVNLRAPDGKWIDRCRPK